MKLSTLLCGFLLSTTVLADIKRIECPIPEVALGSPQELEETFRANSIVLLNESEMSSQDLRDFLGVFSRFPQPLHQSIVKHGGSVLLLHGEGVSEDPNWLTGVIKTVDGNRYWSKTRGSGGNPKFKIPTRIVVNHVRTGDGHGAVNLFLHEHGHALDAIYDEETISKSQAWLSAISQEPKYNAFLDVVCADHYCTTYPKEAFADLFTNYHACEATRVQMERELPVVSAFFKNLNSVEPFIAEKKKLTLPEVKVPSLPKVNVDLDEVGEKVKGALSGFGGFLKDRIKR